MSDRFIEGLKTARDIVERVAQDYDKQGGHKYADAVREAVSDLDHSIGAYEALKTHQQDPEQGSNN